MSVEQWNDALAAEHDIDEYYGRSNALVVRSKSDAFVVSGRSSRRSQKKRLLEVGCGGHVLERFPECDLVGVDVSGAMLAKPRARLAGFRVELTKASSKTWI